MKRDFQGISIRSSRDIKYILSRGSRGFQGISVKGVGISEVSRSEEVGTPMSVDKGDLFFQDISIRGRVAFSKVFR